MIDFETCQSKNARPKKAAKRVLPSVAQALPRSARNAIHTFREGNGRTQLTFFALLADRAGQTLNLEKLDPDAMLHAMIVSFDGEESELRAIIKTLIG